MTTHTFTLQGGPPKSKAIHRSAAQKLDPRPTPAIGMFCAPSSDPSHAIVEVRGTPFPPAVNGGDLLCVDFTQRRLICDSLYVVTFTDCMSPWIGIRRFQLTGSGWRMHDGADGQNVTLLTDEQLQHIGVLGRVKEVYKRDGGT